MQRKIPWLEGVTVVVLALLATILAIPFTMFLKNRWHDALEVRLDFTGNLFSLLFLAMTFVEPIVQFFINVLVPSVFCPLVYFLRPKNSPIPRLRMIFIGLAIALALSLLANGLGMPAIVYAASFLPVLILAGPLLYVQLSSLERRREEEDGRRDLPSLADDAGP